ncbi:response regulator transcription factor [bacterium SCSIO 12741]|nr:response regulator transcription factor [bacterium SCSIO 12741]
MLAFVSNYELVLNSLIRILGSRYPTKGYSTWTDLIDSGNLLDNDLIVFDLPEHLEKEHGFVEFLQMTDRPKILLLALDNSQSLAHYQDRYNVEGIVDYTCELVTLKECIEKILNNEQVRYLNHNFRQTAQSPYPFELKDEEWECLVLIFKGWSEEEITEELGLSPMEQESVRTGIKKKLGVTSDFDLMKWCINRRLFD